MPVPATAGDVTGPFDHAAEYAIQRVVKIHGASIGREKAYGSGVLVSADGKIVTALALLLEGRSLRAVLPDGRTLPARVLARDERRQLALLQVDATDLPHFDLAARPQLQPGDWLLAAANPFKVAEGPEPASIAVGVYSGRASLAARRRAQQFPYEGPVLLADLVVSTPGSAGGAVVDGAGRLAGVIGRAVISDYTNTWINYALPVEEVAAFVNGPHEPAPLAAAAPATQPVLPELGIQLFDLGGRVRPAYVERVRPESLAWQAGVRPNDLVMALNGRPVATCDDFRRLLAATRPDAPITLTIKRGESLIEVQVRQGAEP